jgi:hypothetical protein
MANRILRRDQTDWVDVRRVLGSPDRHRLSVLRDLAASTNRALKDEAPDVSRLREDLAESGWAQALAGARDTLTARLAAAAEPDAENTPATPATAAQQPEQPEQPEQKETEPVTAVEEVPAAQAATTKEGFLRALETSAAADRTCRKHEAVRHALMSALLWSDLQPTDSAVVDVSCVTSEGLFVYEVLGAGHSTYDDLRSGATRLVEIKPHDARPGRRPLPGPVRTTRRRLVGRHRPRRLRRPRPVAHPGQLGRPRHGDRVGSPPEVTPSG